MVKQLPSPTSFVERDFTLVTELDAYGSEVIYCVPFKAIFAIAQIK
ncbi:MAG: hypothetical protein WA997_00150 [Anaerolineales bacterium]|nr:hypothetical protein [Anaerolineales bacterium]